MQSCLLAKEHDKYLHKFHVRVIVGDIETWNRSDNIRFHYRDFILCFVWYPKNISNDVVMRFRLISQYF